MFGEQLTPQIVRVAEMHALSLGLWTDISGADTPAPHKRRRGDRTEKFV